MLSEEEFRQFVSDILLDTKRRQDLSVDFGPNSQSGGTLVPLSDSYNPLIPPTDNEYDLVPEEFRQMFKDSDSTNDDRENSMETTPLPQSIETVFPVVNSNEEYKRMENCYQQCLAQVASVEGNLYDLQDTVKRLEAKLEQVLNREQAVSPPTLLDNQMSKGNVNRSNKKNSTSTVFNLTSRQNQTFLNSPNQRHTIMGSATPQRRDMPAKPTRNTSFVNPLTSDDIIDDNILMPLISRLVEQISLLMESILGSQHEQLASHVYSIVSLSEDMQQVFPSDYHSSSINLLLSNLHISTSALKSLPLIGTADQPLDTNKLISLVIDVSNAAKRLVSAVTDKNVGCVVSTV